MATGSNASGSSRNATLVVGSAAITAAAVYFYLKTRSSLVEPSGVAKTTIATSATSATTVPPNIALKPSASVNSFSGVLEGTPPSDGTRSPRSPGVLAARRRQRRVSGTADPWKASEGDRHYELGNTTEMDMGIDEFLLLDVPTLTVSFAFCTRTSRIARAN